MADDVIERARQAALIIAEALPVREARTAIEPAMSFHPILSTTSTGYDCPGNEPPRHGRDGISHGIQCGYASTVTWESSNTGYRDPPALPK